MRLAGSAVMVLIWILRSTPAVELARAPGAARNRTRRDPVCREHLEYQHSGICCLYCPAGTYVKQHCTISSQRGVCEPCDFGSYTEHYNGLSECLQCTKCRSDQALVEQCSSSINSRCQCKKGYFCLPDQACEVCKTCSKCGEDEEVAMSCTASSNTVCRKRSFSRAHTAVIGVAVVIAAVIVLVIFLYWKTPKCSKAAVASFWSRRGRKKQSSPCPAEEGQSDLNAALAESGPSPALLVGALTPVSVEAVEEEDRGLGESLPNTSASSQNSLCVGAQSSGSSPVRYSPMLPQPPAAPENETFRRLTPITGEESLRKSFELFEEMDVSYHSRFFRHIGLSDNSIKQTESLSLEDRVYQLLKEWMEKEGMKADFNTLIKALLHLNQRLSAEIITSRAVRGGLYQYEEAEGSSWEEI